MPLITLGTGAPDVAPGTYPVTCVGIKATTIPANPLYAKEGETESHVFIWGFTIDGSGDAENDPILVEGITSQMTGPKSNVAAYLAALIGPESLAPGLAFDEKDLVGRQALAQIGQNAKGWPKIEALVPLPRTAAPVRRAATAPVAAAAAPTVRQQAEPEGDELPF